VPITDQNKEIQKTTEFANDESKPPLRRILAARRLLRLCNHSVRAQAVGKRVSKLFMLDEEQPAEVKKKATSLFQFTCDQQENDEDVSDTGALEQPFVDPFANRIDPKSHAEQLVDQNIGWDVPKYNQYLQLNLPAQWINFRFPEDLPAYGIPADPRFKSGRPDSLLETYKVVVDGNVFYVEFWLWWHKVSNPLYIAALRGRRINWACGDIHTIEADGRIAKNLDGNQY
jgi:hypothetical protein